MPKILFRERTTASGEVTSIELFFDLVFVFAITQVSHFLLHHLDWLGAVEAALLLLAVWSAWVDTALVINLLDPKSQGVRTALLALMTVGLVFSGALPDAFGERGLAFAVAFVLFQFGRTLFMLLAARGRGDIFDNFRRFIAWVVVYSAFWIAGGFAEGWYRLALWTVALLIDYALPPLGYPFPFLGRTTTRDWSLDGGHMAERISLFIMIALGESVLVSGAEFAELEWTPIVIGAMASALLQSMAMWWIYFYWTSDLAKSVVSQTDDSFRLMVRSFGYVPRIFVAGIVTAAVGDDLVLAHPLGPIEAPMAWVMIGGPALFLLAAVLFEYGTFAKWSAIRIGALIATLCTVALVPFATPLVLSAVTTAILLAVTALEGIVLARKQRSGEIDMIAERSTTR